MKTFTQAHRGHRRLSIAALLLALLPALCAGEDAAPPTTTMTADVMYGILVGEFAAQYGEWDVAESAMAQVAEQTKDPRIIARAQELAQLRAQNSEGDAQQLLAADNREGALKLLRQHLKDYPEHRAEILTRVNSWLKVKPDSKPDFTPWITRLIQDYENLPEAQLALGLAATRDGNRDVALAALDRALKQRPDWSFAATVKAIALQDKDNSAGIAWLAQWQKIYGAKPGTNAEYAYLLLQDNQFADALLAYEVQMTLDPQDSVATYRAGILASATGDNDKAVRYLKQTLDLGYSGKSNVYYKLGQSYEKLQQNAAAVSAYDQVKDGDYQIPALVRASFLRAHAGHSDEALTRVRAARENNDVVTLWQTEAQILGDQGDSKAALSVLDRGLKQHVGDDSLTYDRALVLDRLGRYQEAISDLRTLMAHKPDDPVVLNALGFTLADRTDQLEEAQQLVEKANRLKPDDPYIMDSLGWVYVRQGKTDIGVKQLQQAYALQAEPDIALHLVEGLFKQGKTSEAHDVWQAALKSNPDNKALQKLEPRFSKPKMAAP